MATLDGKYLLLTCCRDYPDFYKKLYSLLDRNLLHMKYRSRFFRLLELFLSSGYVNSKNLINHAYTQTALLFLDTYLQLWLPPSSSDWPDFLWQHHPLRAWSLSPSSTTCWSATLHAWKWSTANQQHPHPRILMTLTQLIRIIAKPSIHPYGNCNHSANITTPMSPPWPRFSRNNFSNQNTTWRTFWITHMPR